MSIAPIAGTYTHKIIDAHGHTGDFFNKGRCDWGHILNNTLSNSDSVDKVIISNLNGILSNSVMNEIQANEQVLEDCASNKKFIPLAVCRPDKGDVSKIKLLFEKHPNRFAGLKFHPNESKLDATSLKYEPYLQFAKEHNLPCVFHCDNNGFSSPESIYRAAKKIPDTPVVLAHLCSGDTEAQRNGVKVLVESITNGDAKLYTDISWVDFETVKQDKGTPVIVELIKKLKNHEKGDFTNRIMFGSDAPIAEYSPSTEGRELYTKFVENIKKSIRNDDELKNNADEIIDKIFYKNAEELFIEPLSNKKNYNKTTSILAFGALAIGIVSSLIYKSTKSKEQTNTPQNVQIQNTNTQTTGNIPIEAQILNNRLRLTV